MKIITNVFLLCILVNVLFFGFVVGFDTVHADSVAKLPAPELVSVTYNDYSYDVLASTSIDPFTGKTVEHLGYHVDNRTLTLVINKKNIDLSTHRTCYYIQIRGSFSNEWFNFMSGINPVVDSFVNNGVYYLAKF